MDSNIQNFFRNKVVFITGGTGFLGKVFIEKLLRATDVECIYVMVRPKRGKDVKERLTEIFNEPLFEKLHTIRPNPLKFIKPIVGDCNLTDLGISSEDRQELIENVHVVIHSAATVRFNEPLSRATQINVQATVDMLKLAKEMKQLQSFVHVSSAFANCVVLDSEERFYTEHLGITSDELLSIKGEFGNIKLDSNEAELVGRYPNTYCYTKSIAEEAVLKRSKSLPICIFRPGIIIPTCDEPTSGWIDNLYGPMALLFGCVHGVLRVLHARADHEEAYVPADYCANMMMACAWRTGTEIEKRASKDPAIYTLVPDKSNKLLLRDYMGYMEKHGIHFPPTTLIWSPFMILAPNIYIYYFLRFIYHTLPGYLIDLGLLVTGRPVRMTKTYKKVHIKYDLLRYFLDHDFTFETPNCKSLWAAMTADDRRLFNFDMASLNWSEYIYNSFFGLRKYMSKEDQSTIPEGKKLLMKLRLLNRALHGLVFIVVGWLLWSPLSKLIFF